MYPCPPLVRADNETRTRDPRITNALLYQLSHIGIFKCRCKVIKKKCFVQAKDEKNIGISAIITGYCRKIVILARKNIRVYRFVVTW